MNIFASYKCPIKSARLLDTKRANKMIVESYQLMSNAMWIHGKEGFYKKTHLNHPCSIWIAKTRANYQWVFKHSQELLRLYILRFQKTHKCDDHTKTAQDFISYPFAADYLTPFVNCTDFKEISDVHLAYRLHLVRKWYKEKKVIMQFDMDLAPSYLRQAGCAFEDKEKSFFDS